MENLFIEDFDFNIDEVLLVHYCNYVSNFKYTAYTKGRNMAGIVYCISGKAFFTFETRQFCLEPGQMIFLPEKCAYNVQTSAAEPFYHVTANFHICTSEANQSLCDVINGPSINSPIRVDSTKIPDALEKLSSVWKTKKDGFKVQTKSILYNILYLYFTNLNKNLRDVDYDKIRPAKKYIDEHYTCPIPVSTLANLCTLSETHFRRVFTKVTGYSPTEYRMNKRMLLAKDLLLTGDFTVAAIAETCGFDDANYFSRIFKEYTGVSPSEYAKE